MNKKFRLLLVIFLILFSVGSFFAHQMRAPQRNYSDFHCFYTAGKRILNNQNIYVIQDKETSEFRYAPVFAVIMSAFALINEGAADTIWYLINYFLLIISFIYLRNIRIASKDGFRKILSSEKVIMLEMVYLCGYCHVFFSQIIAIPEY